MGIEITIERLREKINKSRRTLRLIDDTDFRIFYTQATPALQQRLNDLIEREEHEILRKWRKLKRSKNLETTPMMELRDQARMLGMDDYRFAVRERLIAYCKEMLGHDVGK